VLALDCRNLARTGHMRGESTEDVRARARVNVAAGGDLVRGANPRHENEWTVFFATFASLLTVDPGITWPSCVRWPTARRRPRRISTRRSLR
jgi:hypothetical protein